MPLTLSQKGSPFYNLHCHEATFDSSYPVGGEPLTKADLGWAELGVVWAPPTSGYSFEYDATNSKIKVFAPLKKYTATHDVASLLTDAVANEAVTVTGVAATDEIVSVIPPAALAAGLIVQSARVASANTVTVRLQNASAGTVDGASGTWGFIVAKANGTGQEVPDTTSLSALTGVLVYSAGFRPA